MHEENEKYGLIYQDMQERALAAFHAFEQMYAVTNPKPPAPRVSGMNLTSTLTIIALAIVVVAAMIVSGSRTIPEFGSVGVAAFFMLEVGSLVYAFRRAMASDGHDTLFSRRLVRWGLLICVVVMLAGNVDATLREHDIVIADWIKTTILLMVAVSAPILTFIAGDILGMEIVSISARRAAAMDVYNRQLDDWQEAKMRSWNAQKAQMGVSFRVERPKTDSSDKNALSEGNLSVQTDMQTDRQTRRSGAGFKRESTAVQTAYNWLTANPDGMQMTLREAAEKIGVGKDAVAKAKRAILQGLVLDAENPDKTPAPLTVEYADAPPADERA